MVLRVTVAPAQLCADIGLWCKVNTAGLLPVQRSCGPGTAYVRDTSGVCLHGVTEKLLQAAGLSRGFCNHHVDKGHPEITSDCH